MPQNLPICGGGFHLLSRAQGVAFWGRMRKNEKDIERHYILGNALSLADKISMLKVAD